ncbi:MAG TPA: hypothetical protein VFX15_04070 [Actinomycetes bacterium]|nr:hypothetical protein [Actinomycetes bacterium]
MQTPDDSACWAGEWAPVDQLRVLWAQSAVLRTVRTLPELHPWRLGDDKGRGGRTVGWCSQLAGHAGMGVLSQIAPPTTAEADDPRQAPALDGLLRTSVLGGAESSSADFDLLLSLASTLPRQVADAVADTVATSDRPVEPRIYTEPGPGVRRWAGALMHIDGSWLPPLAILPKRVRGIDDPGTRWSTESLAFADRHTVHAGDVRYAADLLAPHVTALILEEVPDDAAITIAGDAVHIWWQYDARTRHAGGKVRRAVELAERLVAAVPSFVLTDHPDRSEQVESRIADAAARAAAYRAERDSRLKARRARNAGLAPK